MEAKTGGADQNIHHHVANSKIISVVIGPLFLLLISFSILIAAANALANRHDLSELPDPFTAFANLLPGQSVDTRQLEAQGFVCHDTIMPSPADISRDCKQAMSTGHFSQINLTVWDGVVQWLDLQVRENQLRVGDLALQWGNPEVRIEGNWVRVSWPNRHAQASGLSANGQFSYFQALAHITFVL